MSNLGRIGNLSLSYIKELSDENLIFLFGHLMEKEIIYRKEKGLGEQFLKTYYKNLFKKKDYLLSASAYAYGMRLRPILNELKNFEGSAKVLDAGCGYGTESLLFSILGHEVIGVDLVLERIEIARSRKDFFQLFFNFPLNLKFINANIFNFLKENYSFDFIWVMEAISHIFPEKKFLCLAYDRLKKGGKLIITDPNSLNPMAWIRSVKIRGSIIHRPHQKFKDPETGKPVDYGQEKIFSVLSLKKLLIKIGFDIEAIDMNGFMGTTYLPDFILNKKFICNLLINWQKMIKKTPGLRLFGSIYTIVAKKCK